MLTAYTLSFAGLLLLGGRIADYFGRKRMFVISLIGFAGASALGGLAQNSAMLFGARALQGAFAAVMAPAALSLLTVAFTEPKERARAFAVYGGIAGGGAAIGLILGGVLTEFASWRWTLLINVPIAIAAAVAAFRYVSESRASANHGYDLPGAATVTGGLLALVYGFTKAGTDGWSASTTVTLFAVAAVLLVAFVVIEQRATHPLLPLRVVLDRNRGGSFLASLLVGTAILGTFLSLTYYFQGVLHYSALKTGFAFVPFSLGIITGATAASRLLPRFGPRALLTGGLLMAVAGLALFSTLDVHSTYAEHRAPGRDHRQPRHGSVVRGHEQHRPDRRGPRGRRRGQRPGQRHPADRGHDGRRPHQHHRHQRHGVLRRRPRHLAVVAHRRRHPRLHHRLRLQRHRAGTRGHRYLHPYPAGPPGHRRRRLPERPASRSPSPPCEPGGPDLRHAAAAGAALTPIGVDAEVGEVVVTARRPPIASQCQQAGDALETTGPEPGSGHRPAPPNSRPNRPRTPSRLAHHEAPESQRLTGPPPTLRFWSRIHPGDVKEDQNRLAESSPRRAQQPLASPRQNRTSAGAHGQCCLRLRAVGVLRPTTGWRFSGVEVTSRPQW